MNYFQKKYDNYFHEKYDNYFQEILENKYLYMFYLGVFFSMFIISEIGAYLWHNFGAHTDVLPGVHDTHRIHHIADLSHEAHEDFYYIIIILILVGGGLIYSFYKEWISWMLLLAIYVPLGLTFTWNWWIHSAYHQKDHFLNSYAWFQNDRRIHFQHHINPRVNYGIATHFMDEIFETFDYGFPLTNYEQ